MSYDIGNTGVQWGKGDLFNKWCCLNWVAQMVKRLPAMWETQVQSLGREDPLEKEMTTHSCLENSTDGGAQQAAVHGVAKSRTRLSYFTFFLFLMEKMYRIQYSCFVQYYYTDGPMFRNKYKIPRLNYSNTISSEFSQHLRMALSVCVLAAQSCPTFCDPHGLKPTRLLHP